MARPGRCFPLWDRMKSAARSPRVKIWLLKLPLGKTQQRRDAKTGPPQSDHGRRVRGRLQHKPMQSAQHTPVAISDAGPGAEMLELALRNPITGVPRAREAAAQTHSCGGISTAVKLALRNPITGVPRAREAAAQTHSCGGILTAQARC